MTSCTYKPNDAEKKLMDKYAEMRLGTNEICNKCRQGLNLSRPVGAWAVGSNFYDPKHDKRLMFVGKNARGEIQCSFSDSRGLWLKSWPYWSYARAITEKVYGDYSDYSIENIAYTNIVKCNDSDHEDTTRDETKRHCICELQVLLREIEIIRPTHIVFFTSREYDAYIRELFNLPEKLNYDGTKKIGAKCMPWMEAEIDIEGLMKPVKILRVGHPERKKKNEFVGAISDWVLNN